MPLQLFQIIALLCAVSGKDNALVTDKQQLNCQKWYIDCVYEQYQSVMGPTDSNVAEEGVSKALRKCIQKRTI